MRRTLAGGLTAVLLLLLSLPAGAAGTGGIEVSPIPGVKDGRQITAFHVELPRKGSRQVEFAVRNVVKEPRSARIYVAAATRSGKSFDVGAAGSSPYASYPDQTVTLKAGELRRERFTIGLDRRLERPEGTVLAAVVVEVSSGSLVQRAATLIYLKPQKPWSIPAVSVVAAGLVLLVGFGVISARQRERIPPEFRD